MPAKTSTKGFAWAIARLSSMPANLPPVAPSMPPLWSEGVEANSPSRSVAAPDPRRMTLLSGMNLVKVPASST